MPLILLALVLFGVQGPQATALNSYAGKWVNVESQTRGYEAVQIEVKDGKPVVQIAPFPRPFDGTAYSEAVTRPVAENTTAIIVLASPRTFILKLQPSGRLRMEVYSDYKDGRSNTYRVDEFARAAR